MAHSYRPVDRDQQFLLPPDMRDWVPPEHLVWFLLDVLGQMDLGVFDARHPNEGVGRRAYDPKAVLALLVYGYCRGVRSSRKIEALCLVDLGFRVACANDVPDHTTISRFRVNHQEAFESVFTQVLAVAARSGLARFGTIAIDGTKIAANASLGANRSQEWLAAEVARIVAEAQRADAEEGASEAPLEGEVLPGSLRDPSTRSARIKAAAEELAGEQAAMDAAAAARQAAREQAGGDRLERLAAGQEVLGRIPRGADRVAEAQLRLDQAIAAQQAKIDRRAARIAAGERPGGVVPVPPHQLRRVRQAQAALEAARTYVEPPLRADRKAKQIPTVANITDPQSRIMPTRKGWIQAYNVHLSVSCDQLVVGLGLGQDPTDTGSFIPMMRQTEDNAATLHALTGSGEQIIGTVLADAAYPSDDNLTAPGPPRLIAVAKTRKLLQEARNHPTAGDPPDGLTAREAMDHRLRTPEGTALYKRRGATVEPGIGNFKKLLDRFSRRGTDACLSELNLTAAAFNLLKIHKMALLQT
jgi:transposase